MASPKSIRELRILSGTTMSTAFRNATTASWAVSNAAVLKLKAIDYDGGGLQQEGIPDATLQQRYYTKPAPVPGLRSGTLKIGTYLGSAFTNLEANPEANVFKYFVGGLQLPTTARTTTVGAGVSTTTNTLVVGASTYVVAGQAVLIGTRGDGRGNGKVKPINVVASGSIGLGIACDAAPAAGDTLVWSTTAYPQQNVAQEYIDVLAIGHATADQRQAIGCMGKLSISGLGTGELPRMDLELTPADHRHVPANERSALSPDKTPPSTFPPFDRSMGAFHLGDFNDTTLTTRKAGSFTADLGVAYEEIPGPNGINGKEGWQKVPGAPSLECTMLYDEDMIGLQTDFDSATPQAKTALLQVGHAQGRCFALELPKCYLAALPTDDTLGNLAAVKVTLHGTEATATNNNLTDAAFRAHWF